MSLVHWLVLGGVALFLTVLLTLAWAYATGRLKPASNEPQVRSRWLPHSSRMKPLGHGIYRAGDERRAAREPKAKAKDPG